jgi:hypothetical protein
MAKFYVGQRVKLARPRVPENANAEGVITHIGVWARGDTLPCGGHAGSRFDCVVMFDRPVTDANFFRTDPHAPCLMSQLEPIQPEGWQPVEWSNCLWQPEGVAA